MNALAGIEFLAAVLGCMTDGPRAVRHGRLLFRLRRTRSARRSVQPVTRAQEELVRRLRVADEFRNSTAHEEYRG